MQVFPDFQNEIKAIDPRLDIVQNPNYKALANIKIDGVDICPIPSGEIRDEEDPAYVFMAHNGWKMRHKSRLAALAQVKDTLERLKDPEFYNMFFDKE